MTEPLNNAASATDMHLGDEIDAPAQQSFADVAARIGAKPESRPAAAESNGVGQGAQVHHDSDVLSAVAAVGNGMSVRATQLQHEMAHVVQQGK
jgi:hypothetical protein